MKALAGLLLLFVVSSLHAQEVISATKQSPFSHVVNYVKTHKELLASDAIVVAAEAADSASSVHCQKVGAAYSPNPCVETNPILPKYPSETQYWTYSMGVSAGLITVNSLMVKLARKQDDNVLPHLIWFGTAALAIAEVLNVKSNVDTAENIQNGGRNQARARLAQ